jgi:phage replication-related protein YjqB (UPF0714/DUF867 family)
MPPPPYTSNSQLYADTIHLTEGIDWARRFRRQERFDDDPVRTAEGTRTAILAPHGGGIERGTSELCLAVAGYHPANLPITRPAGVTYDYWMFEGIRESGNADLHVTSTGCDDLVAVTLCAGALGALSLHGFKPENLDPPRSPDEQAIFVGGCDDLLRAFLEEALDDVDLPVEAAAGELDGDSVCNIVNRTLRGRGAQLELSEPLRDTMFGRNTRPGRKHTTTEVFWRFMAACQDALDRFEAEPEIASPDVGCQLNPDDRCRDS